MIRSVAIAVMMTAATVSYAHAKKAKVAMVPPPPPGEFYATPLQHGAPTDLPGERLVPGASETAMLMDGIVGPLVNTPLAFPAIQ